MTQRDKWEKRPKVLRYRAYKDEVGYKLKSIDQFSLIAFLVPMSKSWSKKKKQEMCWTWHTQRPDVDNLIKGLYDAVYGEDSHISMCFAIKIWVPEEHAGIAICKLPNLEQLAQVVIARIKQQVQ